MGKLVSVIIPTHKGSEYVAAAVESVLHQTYTDMEIIVVDDNGLGSEEQEKTYAVLANYIQEGLIKYIPHDVNRNGSAARNTGFSHSSGEYICLLDDDDEYYPDKVEKEVLALDELPHEWGMVYCGFEGNKKAKTGNILFEVLIHSVVIGSNSFLIRRAVWEEVGGFDESFRRHQDYEFTARVAALYKIKFVPFVGFKSKDTNRNIPKNMQQTQDYRKHYIDKMLPVISTLPNYQQKIVICSNAMEVTSKGDFSKVAELLSYSKRWTPKFGMPTIIYVCAMKAIRRIKWKYIKMSR